MTSALKTTALLVLVAEICASFANGRVLLQRLSKQTTAAANTTVSDATSGNSVAPLGVYVLPPFSEVRSCVPFTVLIAAPTNASADGSGVLLVDADKDVSDNMDVTLFDGVLYLSISYGFATNQKITVTVTPGTRSLSAVQNSGTGNLIVDGDFKSTLFTVASVGSGGTYVYGLAADKVRIFSDGSSTVLLMGDVSNGGSVKTGGMAKAYLTGRIGGNVTVILGDFTNTYVHGLPGTAIRGSIDDQAQLRYTGGTCSLQSTLGSPMSERCIQVQAKGAPSFNPSWSCGLQVQGVSQCTGVDILTDGEFEPDTHSPGMSVARLPCLASGPLYVFR
ncbi:hypothetical protein V8C86DRAFT_2463168 [Haematococcus lacustris]